MAEIRAIIWDIDGTLLNSNHAHAEAFRRAFRSEGLAVEYARLRRLIGMGSDHLLPTAAGIDAESAQGKRIVRKKDEIFKTRFFPGLRSFPKARELVETLHRRGLRMAVATSASSEDLRAALDRIGIRRLIDESADANDVESSKPDPDLIRAALKRLRLEPVQALFVGDTPYDIEAGRRAGVPVVVFRCGGWKARELQGAVAIYRDPADLLSHVESAALVGGLGIDPGGLARAG